MREIAIIGLVLAGVVAGATMFFMREVTRDQGHKILVAFGVPDKETTQMHVAVRMGMLRWDPPGRDRMGNPLLAEWIKEHFVLRNQSGEQVRLKRLGMSGLLIDSRAATAAEFCLVAWLKLGENYTLDYIPNAMESKQYRWAFTAPSEAEKPWNKSFLPVDDDQSALPTGLSAGQDSVGARD